MYLDSKIKNECTGCEACKQICPKQAITMQEDEEGFRYPVIDVNSCIHCNACRSICPKLSVVNKHYENKNCFGGYLSDSGKKYESTSGGAFTAIAEAFCDNDYVIFGARAEGLNVFHSYITDINELWQFRKSKYAQSNIGNCYKEVKKFLNDGKKVLFSGTPCQIAALYCFLGNTDTENLLTVEVVCEGIPSPLFMKQYNAFLSETIGYPIKALDYRYKGKSILGNSKWDFQIEKTELQNGKILIRDRWFNPFWSIWLQHLISRPSCSHCTYAEKGRMADITLGDLWGVHLYCPELYGKNGGASLIVCNTKKGTELTKKAQEKMYGHELAFEDALKYQSPMRKGIEMNDNRSECMKDLQDGMNYKTFCKKWARKPSLKLLASKYLWGNRQKIFIWNIKNRKRIKND